MSVNQMLIWSTRKSNDYLNLLSVKQFPNDGRIAAKIKEKNNYRQVHMLRGEMKINLSLKEREN